MRIRVKKSTCIPVVVTTALSMASTALAAEDGLAFSSSCPALLANADAFASRCTSKAISLTRYWRTSPILDTGTPETHSAYFEANGSESRFQLGCTLSSDKSISTLGVYYAPDPSDFTDFKKASLISIDGEGDVVAKYEGREINLTLIREFVTKRIRPERYREGRIRNCEDPRETDNKFRYLHGSFTAKLTPAASGTIVQASPMGTWCNPEGSYVNLLGISENTFPIFVNVGCQTFILDNGSIIVAEPVYKQWCGGTTVRHGIVGESCGSSPR